MASIVFVGPDGLGKTETIKKLLGKYPDKFDSMAFPTAVFKHEINDEVITPVSPNTLSTLIHYHTAFEIDFMVHATELARKSQEKTLLVDRYFPCNMAYAEINFIKHGYQNHAFLSLLHRIDHGIIPDLVILIKAYEMSAFPPKEDSHFSTEELDHIQYSYSMLLPRLKAEGKIKDYTTIVLPSEQFRNERLLKYMEIILEQKGFLK